MNLPHGQTEEVAIGKGQGAVSLNAGKGITKGLVGTRQAKHHFIAVNGQGRELDHAPHYQPDVVPQQGNATASTYMDKATFLIAGFQ